MFLFGYNLWPRHRHRHRRHGVGRDGLVPMVMQGNKHDSQGTKHRLKASSTLYYAIPSRQLGSNWSRLPGCASQGSLGGEIGRGASG